MYRLSIFLLLLIVSCQPTELEEIMIIEEEVEIPSKKWIKHPFFTHSYKLNLHSYSTGNLLLLRGPNAFTFIRVEGDTLEFRRRLNFVTDYGFEHKIPMNEDVIVTVFDFHKRIQVNCNRNVSGIPLVIAMEEFDSTFTRFYFPNYRNGKAILNTESSKLVIPYIGNIAKILIVEYLYENCNTIKLVDYAIVQGENSSSLQVTRMLELSNGNILISGFKPLGGFTGIIDKENNFTEVMDDTWLLNFFEFDNQYFGLVFDDIHYSDDGFHWEMLGTVDSNLSSIRYSHIEDRLIGHFNSQIFEFHFSKSEYKIWELDNDGLQDHTITSINRVGDYVFVTTLSGVFYKAYEDFFDLKNNHNTEDEDSEE